MSDENVIEIPVPEIELRAGEFTSFNFAFNWPCRVEKLDLPAPQEIQAVKIGADPRKPVWHYKPELGTWPELSQCTILPTRDSLTIEVKNIGTDPVLTGGTLLVRKVELKRLGAT